MAVPDFVVVGHVTRDLIGDGEPRLGGSAAYAAVAAHNLGRQVGIVTSFGPDLALDALPSGIEIANTSAPQTTTFRNEAPLGSGPRRQYVTAQASPLDVEQVPWPWLDTQVLLAAPVLGEVDATMLGRFQKSLVGVEAQGWLRRWDGSTETPLAQRGLATLAVLPAVGVLFLSEEDFAEGLDRLTEELGQTPIALVTQASRGAQLWWQERWQAVPAYPVAREIDSTGAGDVFAAAYLVRLSETRDPLTAARFANAMASLSVEGVGMESVPQRRAVEERMAEDG